MAKGPVGSVSMSVDSSVGSFSVMFEMTNYSQLLFCKLNEYSDCIISYFSNCTFSVIGLFFFFFFLFQSLCKGGVYLISASY